MNSPSVDKALAIKKKGFIQRAFPVPKSLILSNMAIDVSDSRLRFFEVSRNRDEITPKSYGSMEFPNLHLGSLNEKSRNEAIAALTTWAKNQKCESARLVIHEGEAYVFKITVPTTIQSEIRASIEGVLEENVPVHPNEAVFEFDVISKDTTAGTSLVAVSVISKGPAREIIEIFNASGIQVVSLETESRALSRALFPKHDEGTHAVISINEHHSVIFIVEKGAVVFSSALEVGSIDLDRAIAKEFGITQPAARALKLEKAFSESDGDMKLFEAMAPTFSLIQEELGKMLVYWRTQNKKNNQVKEIKSIVLSGGDTLIAGFSRYVTSEAHVPVKPGSVWTNVLSVEENIPNILYRDSFEYGTVIGALL